MVSPLRAPCGTTAILKWLSLLDGICYRPPLLGRHDLLPCASWSSLVTKGVALVSPITPQMNAGLRPSSRSRDIDSDALRPRDESVRNILLHAASGDRSTSASAETYFRESTTVALKQPGKVTKTIRPTAVAGSVVHGHF
jgi:hypothetical protein